eukprot:scaffold64606_cov59-Phaeocystis_antarctica.AAC.2
MPIRPTLPGFGLQGLGPKPRRSLFVWRGRASLGCCLVATEHICVRQQVRRRLDNCPELPRVLKGERYALSRRADGVSRIAEEGDAVECRAEGRRVLSERANLQPILDDHGRRIDAAPQLRKRRIGRSVFCQLWQHGAETLACLVGGACVSLHLGRRNGPRGAPFLAACGTRDRQCAVGGALHVA